MIQVLDATADSVTKTDLGGVIGFFGWIWNVISELLSTIIDVINFLKDLILAIPKFLDILPNEITILLIPAITIIIFVFIFKFVK